MDVVPVQVHREAGGVIGRVDIDLGHNEEAGYCLQPRFFIKHCLDNVNVVI